MTADEAPKPNRKSRRAKNPGLLAGLPKAEMERQRGRLGGAARAAAISPEQASAIALKASLASVAARAAKRAADGIPPAKKQSWGSAKPSAEDLAPFMDEALARFPDASNYELRRKAQALRRNWLVRSEFGLEGK